MDYQKIYNEIIERAKTRILAPEIYVEKHHIIPKCLGGLGSTKTKLLHSNLVLLTAREHFLAHWLLYRMYPNNISLGRAFFMMSSCKKQQRNYKVSSRSYEEARIANFNAAKQFKHTQKAKNKISLASKNLPKVVRIQSANKSWIKRKGFKHSEETKKIISEKQIGKKVSQETKDKISKAHLGSKRSNETKKLLSLRAKNRKPISETTRNLIALGASKGKIKAFKFPSMEFVGEYLNTIEAQNNLNISNVRIGEVVNGKKDSYKGYYFERIAA